MKSGFVIPKELLKEIEDYSKAEGIEVNAFILWALGEKVGELRERRGVKTLSRISQISYVDQHTTVKSAQQ